MLAITSFTCQGTHPMFAVVILFWSGASAETPGHALMMLAHGAMVGGMMALMI